ncbi:hypothetical protein ACFYXM_12145 [Streptomyces sp. NPDC002476]|uniref:hypothetical protein n=1 Tax=Streptomyces sp. NPDC002476 TaxID=3364648 RepID=UPI003675BED3
MRSGAWRATRDADGLLEGGGVARLVVVDPQPLRVGARPGAPPEDLGDGGDHEREQQPLPGS